MDIGSVLTTLMGGAGGGLLRMAPEMFKIWDRRNERAHELALQDGQIKLLQVQSNTHLAEIAAQGDQTQAATALEALRDSINSQGKATGIKWVDALSSFVRPYWTYLVLNLWAAIKVTDVIVTISRKLPWEQARPLIWNADDTAMLAALSAFWFLDRVYKRQGR